MAKYVKTEQGYKKFAAVTYDKMDKIDPTGTGSFSMGRKPGTVVGINSHTEGNWTTASGEDSHAEGYNTTASSYNSHAEGSNTKASGEHSHAEGFNTKASGNYSHAEGNSTTASWQSSHAEGNATTASGQSSHAEGSYTTASGDNSHAEGYSTNKFLSVVTTTNPTTDDIITAWKTQKFSVAKGNSSHVEGKDNLALSNYSHAEGYRTIASGDNSHAQGKYNIEDTSNIYSDIIGNGISNDARSNAYTLDWSGNAWFAGDVYTGSTSGINKDEGSKKLATEEYVNNSITATSVLYTAQSLTDEQKVQARQNIGAQDLSNGLTPVTVTYINPFYNTTDTSTTYLLQGTLKVFDDNSPTDVKKAFAIVMNVLGGHVVPNKAASCRDLFDKLRILYDNGLITIPFKAYPNKYDRNYWVSLSFAYQNTSIIFNCVRSDRADGFYVTLRYDLETSAYVEQSCYSEQAVKSSLKGLTGTPTIAQVQIQSDPTADKEIATKQYVDNAPIKQASATALGGVKVGQGLTIADDGTLSINIASAAVGQIIKVKAIDESGKPTEWEAADMSGLVERDVLICNITGNGSTEIPYVCDRTFTEIEQAVAAGKVVYARSANKLYSLTESNLLHRFDAIRGGNTESYVMNLTGAITRASLQLQNAADRVTSISMTSTDTQYPSAKCMYDELEKKQGKPEIYEATFSSGGWSMNGSGYYEQSLTVEGLKRDYVLPPDIDIKLSGTDASQDAQLLADWALVSLAQVDNDTLVLQCVGGHPTSTLDMPVIVRVWQ